MKKAIGLVVLVLMVCTALAHEFILLASSFRVRRGDTLTLRLFVADGFNIEAQKPYLHTLTQSFGVHTTEGYIPLLEPQIVAEDNVAAPMDCRLRVDFEGGALVHMERNHARISMATPKFFDYLKEDHIEGIAPKVDKRKPEQHERYTRNVKALVQSSNTYTDTLYKARLGQALEIRLLQNPYGLNPGATLQAEVTFRGKPLAGKVITARNRTGNLPAMAITARTDARGVCTFRLNRGGDWFLHATHMIPNEDKRDADWESFWATYSFGLD